MVTHKKRNNVVRIATSMLVLVLSTLEVMAATISTPAGNGAQVLWSAFEWYAKDHDEQIATSWEQLSSQFDQRKLEGVLGAPIDTRFAFFGSSGPTDSRNGTVVLITKNTIVEDRRETQGRYIVWHKNGKFRCEWEDETVAAAFFTKAGQHLPTSGVWVQPNTKHAEQMMGIKEPLNLDAKGNVVKNTTKTNDQLPIARESSQDGAKRQMKTSATDNVPESLSYRYRAKSLYQGRVVWILAVIVATAGAVWVFLRKSKSK